MARSDERNDRSGERDEGWFDDPQAVATVILLDRLQKAERLLVRLRAAVPAGTSPSEQERHREERLESYIRVAKLTLKALYVGALRWAVLSFCLLTEEPQRVGRKIIPKGIKPTKLSREFEVIMREGARVAVAERGMSLRTVACRMKKITDEEYQATGDEMWNVSQETIRSRLKGIEKVDPETR